MRHKNGRGPLGVRERMQRLQTRHGWSAVCWSSGSRKYAQDRETFRKDVPGKSGARVVCSWDTSTRRGQPPCGHTRTTIPDARRCARSVRLFGSAYVERRRDAIRCLPAGHPLSSAIISSASTDTLLPALTSNGIQHGKDALWLTGCHLTRRTVMHMIRETREPREMRRIMYYPQSG